MLSRKNHKMIDGKLLQTDKKYSHLKLKQKEKIAEWMYLETKAYYEKNYTFPGDKQIGDVISKVYDRITDADIWIPYGEVVKHYNKKNLPKKRGYFLFNQLSLIISLTIL